MLQNFFLCGGQLETLAWVFPGRNWGYISYQTRMSAQGIPKVPPSDLWPHIPTHPTIECPPGSVAGCVPKLQQWITVSSLVQVNVLGWGSWKKGKTLIIATAGRWVLGSSLYHFSCFLLPLIISLIKLDNTPFSQERKLDLIDAFITGASSAFKWHPGY